MQYNLPAIGLTFIETLVLPAIFTVAFVAFVWALFQLYTEGAYNELVKEKAKTLMLWSTLVMVVMIAIWTLGEVVLGRLAGIGGGA